MSYVKEKAVEWAKTQVGFHEGPNNANPYSDWQYGNPYNPWCASFQCQAQYIAGYRFKNCTYGEKGEAYTPTEAQRAQDQGTWRNKWWRAQPGDAVLFDWGNNGLIDHVELVVYDDGVLIITIGGNTSDGVYYRTRDRTYVAGFWALSQDSQAKPPINWAAIAAAVKYNRWKARVSKNPLKYGDKSPDVKILKELLIAKGFMVHPLGVLNEEYTKSCRSGVHHFKRVYQLGNDDGRIFAAEAAEAILKPKPKRR